MKGDDQIVLDEMLNDVGVASSCSACHRERIRAYDENAERMAYARATNLWKEGRFRGMSRQELIRLVKDALEDLPDKCPVCSSS